MGPTRRLAPARRERPPLPVQSTDVTAGRRSFLSFDSLGLGISETTSSQPWGPPFSFTPASVGKDLCRTFSPYFYVFRFGLDSSRWRGHCPGVGTRRESDLLEDSCKKGNGSFPTRRPKRSRAVGWTSIAQPLPRRSPRLRTTSQKSGVVS